MSVEKGASIRYVLTRLARKMFQRIERNTLSQWEPKTYSMDLPGV
ncbi:hypothetical protein [Mesobacillus foraminis]|nr:hypothetical protein [Mesobacillus foraminis]